MLKPLTVKITGDFEIKETLSLGNLTTILADAQQLLQERLGPGALVLKIGRQEYTV